MVLLDTNILIELLKKNELITNQLHGIGFTELVTCDIVVAELVFGALNKADLRFIERSIRGIPALPLLPPISELAVSLMKNYTLSNRLGLADAFIAATTLHHNLPLFTLNRKDFRYIAGLTLHEPVQA